MFFHIIQIKGFTMVNAIFSEKELGNAIAFC